MKTKCILLAIFFALALPMTATAFGSITQNVEQHELKVDLNQVRTEYSRALAQLAAEWKRLSRGVS